MPIPTVRQFLKRGVARALPPRVLCAAPERIPYGRIWSVGFGRDFQNQYLGMGLFLVRLPEGSFPPAGTGCGLPGAGWQHVSCTGGPSEKEATPHFLELFAGAGGLTTVVRRLNLPAFGPQDLKSDESGFNFHFDS